MERRYSHGFRTKCFRSARCPRVALRASSAYAKQTVTARSVAAPHHGHRSRKTAAHVEREESSHILNLARAGLSGKLLIGFVNLANPCRAYRVTVADQAATRVHRNFEWRFGFL